MPNEEFDFFSLLLQNNWWLGQNNTPQTTVPSLQNFPYNIDATSQVGLPGSAPTFQVLGLPSAPSGGFPGSFGGMSLGISQGLDAVGNIASMFGRGLSTFDGPKGNVRAGIELGWNAISDAAANLGPYGQMVSMGMKAVNALNGIQGAIFGATDGMTTTDAIMDSPLGFLTGVGWVNLAFGKKAETITKDDELFAEAGSSYGGTSATVDSALEKSGKKYGAFSVSARHKANDEIREAKRQQNVMSDIVDNASNRMALKDSMSAINSNRRAFALLGGYNQGSVRVGKLGMSIEATLHELSLNDIPEEFLEPNSLLDILPEFKEGGILEVTLEDIPEEFLEDTPLSFANGGELEEQKELDIYNYVHSRFPITRNLNIVLYNDPNFNPQEIGDYGNIEYWPSLYDTIPYYNDYPKPEELKGKSIIIYNNNVIDEDIALDMVSHGLREQDLKWKEYYLPNLEDDDVWEDMVFQEQFENFSKIPSSEWVKLSDKLRRSWIKKFKKSEEYKSGIDGLIRALLVKDELSEKLRYNYSKKELDALKNSDAWKEAFEYINSVEKFAEGGKFNVIPEGALHARLHHMENADNLTKKGIPVVAEDENGELELLAEIEREEIIFRLEVTKKLEELMEKYNSSSQKEKDEAAIEAGKLLVEEILNNTIDNTNSLL